MIRILTTILDNKRNDRNYCVTNCIKCIEQIKVNNYERKENRVFVLYHIYVVEKSIGRGLHITSYYGEKPIKFLGKLLHNLDAVTNAPFFFATILWNILVLLTVVLLGFVPCHRLLRWWHKIQ
jgi:hypothetical protein